MVPHVPSNSHIYYLPLRSLVNLILHNYNVMSVLDEISVLGADNNSYPEYENLNDPKQWVLLLRQRDVWDSRV